VKRIAIPLFRAFAGVLVVGAILHVGSLLSSVLEVAATLPAGAWLFTGSYAACAFTALAACGLAVLLLWKASHKADGRALTLFLGFLAVFWGSFFRFLDVTATADDVAINLNYTGQWVNQSAVAAWLLAVAAFVRFSAIFPRPLTPDRLPPPGRLRSLRRLRIALLGPYTIWIVASVTILLASFTPSAVARYLDVDSIERAVQVQSVLLAVNLGTVLVAYILIPAIAIVLGVRNLRASYRMSSGDEKRRMLWVVMGFTTAGWLILLALAGVILIGALDMPERLAVIVPVLVVLGPLVIVLGCALGVLYHGAIDPRLALRRSTIYGILGALGIVVFAGVENLLSALVERGLALPGFLGPLVAGGIAAAVLIPVQKKMKAAFARRTSDHENAVPATQTHTSPNPGS
jgi:hypothetical protein